MPLKLLARSRHAEKNVEIRRHGERVQLCHVCSGRQSLKMITSAGVRYGIAAVLEVNPNVGHTLFLAKRTLAAVRLENAPDERCGRAKQIFSEANQCARFIRNQATGGKRRGRVHKFLVTLAADNLDDIINLCAPGNRQRRNRELQYALVRSDERIRRFCTVDPHRTGHEAQSGRQLVNNPDVVGDACRRRILQQQLVAHEVTR